MTQAPADAEVVTAEFKLNLLRPAIGEHFVATGEVVSAGQRLIVCTSEVHALAGGARKPMALMQATIAVVPGAAS